MRCRRSWGHLRARLPGHVCPEPLANSSKGPQIRRMAPACPSKAPPTGLGADAQRQPLLQGSPAALVPTCQLPGQPWTRPQQVPHQPGRQFPYFMTFQGIHVTPPRLWHPDSPVPITSLSTHAHLCNCSQPTHTCRRPAVTQAHLATHIPMLHTLPAPIAARAHMPTHSPHTCSMWATCRYDHTADSVNIAWVPTWYLATPLLCEEHEHPQLTMISSPTLHPLKVAHTTLTWLCVQCEHTPSSSAASQLSQD